ncbi:hypothetical protein A7A08_01633 [Methyloligella halotolerans]|uniref:Uncharacterized protein n=1 Tax=Methyloligella halotolerans TaxID=1177755 RepID=A0A1E2RZW6_9HYPH|nr:hypothetical protein [Methyloligella halotolerans]ODA67599.1 hypothetical protein A7A08_01633 [Methyloligella halotolerans]
MGAANDNDEQLEYYRLPGEVSLSEAALEYAREFAEALSATGPRSNWLVSIDWGTTRSTQYPDGTVEDHGPGLNLGGDRRERYPAAALHDGSGFQFAIAIPNEVLDASEKRLIDYDPPVFGNLIVR